MSFSRFVIDVRGRNTGTCLTFIEVLFALATEVFLFNDFLLTPLFSPAAQLDACLSKLTLRGIIMPGWDLHCLTEKVCFWFHALINRWSISKRTFITEALMLLLLPERDSIVRVLTGHDQFELSR